MNVLLVYPEFPDTFWSHAHALRIAGKKALLPPLGLLTVAAMLPPHWGKRLIDLNVSPLSDADLAWADCVFVSGMAVQREAARRVIARCKASGKTVAAGGLAPGSAQDLPSAFQTMRQGGAGEPTRMGRLAPLILFHGDADSTVHPCNADHLVQQWTAARSQGPGSSTPSVTVQQGQVTGGRAYTREIYRDDRGQSVVERWTIHGAGHAWSGGSRSGSYTDPAGPDAFRELARFFQEHPRGTAAVAA